MMDGNQIATFLAVLIGGILTYEYSAWRTKRIVKKLAAPYQPLLKVLTPSPIPTQKVPITPKGKQADDYE